MPAEAIKALVRFARTVSNADLTRDVTALLAEALTEHVCPSGIAIFVLEEHGLLGLATQRKIPELAQSDTLKTPELDEVGQLGDYVLQATKNRFKAQLTRPLVAGANLFGGVVLCYEDASKVPNNASMALDVGEGLIDLAALALENDAHVAQLERQYAELHAQQEMLIRTEKLRALGQMAAGVSHDVRNILNPLSLHIQLITRGIDRGQLQDAKESAVEMKQVLQRGLQTLDRLRDFSRQNNEGKSELVEVDTLVREAVAIGKARAASRGNLPRIQDDGLSGPPPVMAISSEIVSAVVNLIVNAIDALASAAKAAAATGGGPPSSGGATGTITLRSGEDDKGVWIEVADDGPGMPPEVANRVFEPFFTTKGEEGTGLGLAMVYATMQRHGGSVTIDTKQGKGTTFRLSLPTDGPMSRSMPYAGASSAVAASFAKK